MKNIFVNKTIFVATQECKSHTCCWHKAMLLVAVFDYNGQYNCNTHTYTDNNTNADANIDIDTNTHTDS